MLPVRTARHPLLFVFVFMVLLLAPVLDTVAQSGPVRVAPTEEPDLPLGIPPTEEPTREPIRVSPTEEPTDEPLPERIPPTEEPAGEFPISVETEEPVEGPLLEESPHNLFLHKRECPIGFDRESDWSTFLAECTNLVDAGFNVTDGQGPIFQETNAAFANWLGIDFGDGGDLEITETIPDGYGEPEAFCAMPPGEQQPENYDTTRLDPVDGQVTVSPVLGENDIYVCYFFNFLEPGEGGVVILDKWRCPMGVPEDAERDDYEEICTEEHNDVEFTLDHAGGSFPETTANGEVVWTDLPTGDYTIQETLPPGFKDPIVFCGFSEIPGDALGAVGLVPSVGGLLNLTNPGDGYELTCWVFNIPDPDAGTTVTVHKANCPTSAFPDHTLASYQAECTDPGDGIEFTLDNADGSATQAIAGGSTTWTSVPMGDFTLTETIPPEYGDPLWWCGETWIENGAPVLGLVAEVSAPGGVLTDSIDHPQTTYTCWVFNVLDRDHFVRAFKWECPQGTDPGDKPFAEWANLCTAPMDGVEFTLTDVNGSSTKSTVSGVGVNGHADWYGAAEGELTLTETPLPGYLDPVVFCGMQATDEAGNPVAAGPDPYVVTDNSVTDTFNYPEFVWVCHFLNIPVEDGSSVTVQKWLCPEAYDPDAAGADPSMDCIETMGGVTFTLGDMEETTGDDQGVAIFSDVPEGDHVLTEVMPDGIAFGFPGECQNPGPGQLLPALVTDPPSVSLEVGEGDHWFCHWYNIPEEPNRITLYKWECPEGTTYDQDLAWYANNCTAPMFDVQFTLASDLGIAVADTGAIGQLTFDGLQAGEFGIQETIPEGFGAPVVVCSMDAGPSTLYPAPTGHISEEFAEGGGYFFFCYYYNVPAEPPDLTILKWTCPEGYDLEAAGADPKTDCTEATNGIQFQFGLAAPAAEAVLQTTGDVIPGGVFFDDLEPDIYKAVELVPEGITQVFVLECTGHLMGVLQSYPLQMGNVLDEIDVDAGEHLVCHWYNVPEPDGGTLTVIKSICTTETFVSEVDCEIYEDGQTFDLLWWDGAAWQVAGTEVTDGVGRITWIDLEPGDYWLDEHDAEWCHIVATPAGDEDSFAVAAGEETVVEVYNCDPDWSTTTIPQKYPNTGAPPISRDDQLTP